ncbi:hypothetical protein DVH24_025410 [Malus domestica]|uniref:Uncharacterized protein n=1 Tax=Malus domestica TaxID=3750 RepID=A0A498HLV2_MALDO|nr:hypothetical protein DVH24_025410 [Malus domestica]
MYLLINGLMP